MLLSLGPILVVTTRMTKLLSLGPILVVTTRMTMLQSLDPILMVTTRMTMLQSLDPILVLTTTLAMRRPLIPAHKVAVATLSQTPPRGIRMRRLAEAQSPSMRRPHPLAHNRGGGGRPTGRSCL